MKDSIGDFLEPDWRGLRTDRNTWINADRVSVIRAATSGGSGRSAMKDPIG